MFSQDDMWSPAQTGGFSLGTAHIKTIEIPPSVVKKEMFDKLLQLVLQLLKKKLKLLQMSVVIHTM